MVTGTCYVAARPVKAALPIRHKEKKNGVWAEQSGDHPATPRPVKTKLCANLRVFLRRNQSGHHGLSRNRETAMKIAKIILAGTAALTIISSAAVAQQALTGTVTKIDRINRTIAIQQTLSGTIGANTGGAAREFKAQDSLSLDTLHAGDKVTFSATETGGINITKLQKQ